MNDANLMFCNYVTICISTSKCHRIWVTLSTDTYIAFKQIFNLPHVRPHPVMAPLPPGLEELLGTVPGEMLEPMGTLLVLTTTKSLGVKPEPCP